MSLNLCIFKCIGTKHKIYWEHSCPSQSNSKVACSWAGLIKSRSKIHATSERKEQASMHEKKDRRQPHFHTILDKGPLKIRQLHLIAEFGICFSKRTNTLYWLKLLVLRSLHHAFTLLSLDATVILFLPSPGLTP